MRNKIVAEARNWIGTDWVHQGRSIYGIDCVGLILVVGKKLGAIDPDYDNANYQRQAQGADLLTPFRYLLDQKPICDIMAGDIVVLRDNFYPCHAGIIASKRNKLTMIHSDALRKKVIEEFIDQSGWRRRIVADFTYRGIS
jgi:cell wall-associated NlpC family hydrolase